MDDGHLALTAPSKSDSTIHMPTSGHGSSPIAENHLFVFDGALIKRPPLSLGIIFWLFLPHPSSAPTESPASPLPLVFGSTTRSRFPMLCTPRIPAPSAPVFGPPSPTLADFGPRPSFAVALPDVQPPKPANDEYAEAVATLAAHTQPGSAPLPSPISIPVLIVPPTRPPAPVHLGQSHLHASVFAASHPLSPTPPACRSLPPTLCLPRATQPLDTGLTAVRAAQPLVPLAATVHAVTITFQEAPLSAHATPRCTPPTRVPSPPRLPLVPSPSYPPSRQLTTPRHEPIYHTFRLRLPGPRSAICAAVDAIPRTLSICIRIPHPHRKPRDISVQSHPAEARGRAACIPRCPTFQAHPLRSHLPLRKSFCLPIPPLLPLPYKRYLLRCMHVLHRPAGLA
ncbi:hypothetical protein B0H14DRAFT_3434839 [Mycena olivaceomarginata]|nr:hypothetical protein B0H14DRAFT_3434839 [Mycena olivaceomarginata]